MRSSNIRADRGGRSRFLRGTINRNGIPSRTISKARRLALGLDDVGTYEARRVALGLGRGNYEGAGAQGIAGDVLLFLCSVPPVLFLAWWAVTPGHHPSPFLWSMTDQTFRLILATPLLYLGAFLSGLRPARWWGTRLLPLACAYVAAVLTI